MFSLRAVHDPITISLCPFCKSSLIGDLQIVGCFLCNTPHHDVCWHENHSRCSIFHCPGTQTFLYVECSESAVIRRIVHSWVLYFALNGILLLVIPFFGDFLVVPPPLLYVIGVISLARTVKNRVRGSTLRAPFIQFEIAFQLLPAVLIVGLIVVLLFIVSCII